MAQTTAQKQYSLDSLSNLDTDTLESIYRSGTVPQDISVLNGRPKGRMLSVRYTDNTPAFDALKFVSSANFFPWDGKSFFPLSAQNGRGINRIKVLTSSFDWFPFETKVVNSVIDYKPCILLDYDQPENPWFITMIRDEIREVSPKLFMGPAMWKDGNGGATLVLWFAVDFNTPSDL
jgi:hypothetical protein